jgi:anthranilate phosphoribosyltransferase
MTTPDIAGLCKRLRVHRNVVVCGVRMPEYVNPDGPEAADTLERQAAENKRLRGALRGLLEIDDDDVVMDTPSVKRRLAEARAALTGEDHD